MQANFQIRVKGVVQGVGFRPFVYRLAKAHQLKGTVSNNAEGVLIQVQASEAEARAFLQEILQKPPPAARILTYKLVEVCATDFPDFRIVDSDTAASPRLPLTPDTAPCLSCQQEVLATQNRRFAYPFTTCTYCGPRYAITETFPFEREHTSLAQFSMCLACQEEYKTPENRRFHSQTNTCTTCGVSVWLDLKTEKLTKEVFTRAVQELSKGKILAVKNTTGYLLCADAQNEETLMRLREQKHRPQKPFALLYPSLDEIKKDFAPTEAEIQALVSPLAPIVLLKGKPEKLPFVAAKVAPNLQGFGVMLPSSSLLFLLVQRMGTPLVATSGNRQGSPIIAQCEVAHTELDALVDGFLEHNLPIRFPQDDSVLRFAGDQQIILRRSRGLAPNYPKMLAVEKPILAMGADLKSTFALATGEFVYMSPYLGNLENYTVQERYEATIQKYLKLFGVAPALVLADAHPQYQSHQIGKQLAEEWKADFQTVPHHEAHLYSVLGENDLVESSEKILGVVWDGTGLGTDGAIWGGEFFSYSVREGVKRTNHFTYFPWLANDKMSLEPRLSLLSLSEGGMPEDLQQKFSATELRLYQQLKEKNRGQTSSVGRLFDAAGALLACGDLNTFEGQTAMQLETLARRHEGKAVDLFEKIRYQQPSGQEFLTQLRKRKKAGESCESLAAAFHQTLVEIILREARRQQVSQIACSGGVFQNTLLLEMLQAASQDEGFALFFHQELSPNDENIAFGQLQWWVRNTPKDFQNL